MLLGLGVVAHGGQDRVNLVADGRQTLDLAAVQPTPQRQAQQLRHLLEQPGQPDDGVHAVRQARLLVRRQLMGAQMRIQALPHRLLLRAGELGQRRLDDALVPLEQLGLAGLPEHGVQDKPVEALLGDGLTGLAAGQPADVLGRQQRLEPRVAGQLVEVGDLAAIQAGDAGADLLQILVDAVTEGEDVGVDEVVELGTGQLEGRRAIGDRLLDDGLQARAQLAALRVARMGQRVQRLAAGVAAEQADGRRRQRMVAWGGAASRLDGVRRRRDAAVDVRHDGLDGAPRQRQRLAVGTVLVQA